ncbi:MAG: hypothetical protein U9N02_07905 [Campylobacterota bacterium]|nr:hypothetical protein [Campylobacterota bacterium]
MKILQFFLLLLFFQSTISANIYRDMVKVSLKKDEQKKVLVKYGKIQKLFQFRWTLFINDGLIILKSYDDIVSQNILYLNHKNQSVRIELLSRGANNYKTPYILVKFIEFDYEKHEAKFELFLSDDEMRVRVKYLKND